MESMIDILIPTYNRAEFISKNLDSLILQIHQFELASAIKIFISDNNSSDRTEFVVKAIIRENKTIDISYFKQSQNIGLEANVVSLMARGNSPYVLWIGDDDFLAEGYLKFCTNQINTQKMGCIIPGVKSIYRDGSIKEGRIENFEIKAYQQGYEAMIAISHLAHQMSGLLMYRENLLSSYLKNPSYRNPYLFIYWTAYCLFNWGGVYAPIYKTGVTTYNNKDWGYNKVGLLDEVCKSYYSFLGVLGDAKVAQLIIRFTVIQSWRLDIKPYRPLRLLKQYIYLSKKILPIKNIKFRLAFLLIFLLIKEYIVSFNIFKRK